MVACVKPVKVRGAFEEKSLSEEGHKSIDSGYSADEGKAYRPHNHGEDLA